MSREQDIAAYHRGRDRLLLALHELPTGVLWGLNGATPAQCAQMLDEVTDFERCCERLGLLPDHAETISQCRWHLDHYPHYLGRRRHFTDYATYVSDRAGPQRVAFPPVPRSL